MRKTFSLISSPHPCAALPRAHRAGTRGDRRKLQSVPASGASAHRSPDPAGEIAPGKHIVLIIDDERTQRIILREALEQDGYAVAEAENGLAGLEEFDRVRPDIVLLDVRMPVMDGFAACSAMRSRTYGENVPILMFTVLDDPDSIDHAYEAGATDFVTKPVVWPILGRRLRYMLRAGEAFQNLARSEADLSRRVAERTAELDSSNRRLEVTNRELEAFTYSVSHDLRAPLRAIKGFTDLLFQNPITGLDASSTDHLHRIRAAANRMDQLVVDLLDLSKVTRHEICRSDVDLSALALEVTEALARDHPYRQVEVLVEPGMLAEADPGLLRTLLENLLGNAWKFTERTAAARIAIGTLATDGGTAYVVRDNGAGFDMQYADRLFAPFQRLHTQTEFAGSGVGLAIVQRIVARHDGRVWAEGEPERGAVFYFTLN